MRHRRIAGDVEPPVAAARLRFAAGQRHVDVADLVDLKALADRLDAAERFEQRRAADRRGGRTPRGRCPSTSRPQQPIAHPAADDERAAAGVADGARDLAAPAAAGRSNSASGPIVVRADRMNRGAIAFDDAEQARGAKRVHLGCRRGDRARDRVGDRRGVLLRAVGAGREAGRRVITSKNSVSVDIGIDDGHVDARAAQLGAQALGEADLRELRGRIRRPCTACRACRRSTRR